MKLRSEKGFTGVDIAIAIVVLFIFVSIIVVLIYNFNIASEDVQRKTDATFLAVQEIEKVKNEGFEAYSDKNASSGNIIDNAETEKEGFTKTMKIEDYADLKQGKIPNIVKKVTVQIKYMFKAKEQTVELSTILSKEN